MCTYHGTKERCRLSIPPSPSSQQQDPDGQALLGPKVSAKEYLKLAARTVRAPLNRRGLPLEAFVKGGDEGALARKCFESLTRDKRAALIESNAARAALCLMHIPTLSQIQPDAALMALICAKSFAGFAHKCVE